MIPNSVKHIYYRGFLKSCSYSCSYCPFAKRPANEKELKKDKEALSRFVSWVEGQKNTLSIMFVPYGEAMIHTHYTTAFARLSRLPNVTAVSCQTNLSLNPERFIKQLKDENADLSKLNLWATFHNEMENQERFAEKVHYLSQHINLCVGVVGTPQMVSRLSEFKSLLPKYVYLWVNAMEGLNRKYTAEELGLIEAIDPQFRLELANPKADIGKCCAGRESLFIMADGDVFACNRSKLSLGNCYDTKELASPLCKTRACDCFLAYAHRNDMNSLSIFGSGRFIRIPKGIAISTLFFDIDGTLTNSDGTLAKLTVEAVEQLSKSCNLYLATALPFAYAMRKCRAIQPYLSGGVFANGADLRIFSGKYRQTIPMQPPEAEVVKGVKTFCYSCKGVLYKLAFTGKSKPVELLYKRLAEQLGNQYHIAFEDGVISVTAAEATKLLGILRLCKKLGVNQQNVMTVGNAENDIEMLGYFVHSAAVQSASDKVKSHPAYTMGVEHLPIFIR